ncbi:MAG: metal homeostatis BSD2 family protein, partial [Candidatus Omnitrophica bacterium]|nr:metal homeostatis BSD2 family protein [Candidatus Omnitrophota bacterium]
MAWLLGYSYEKNVLKIAAEYILVIIFGLFILISRIYDFTAVKIIRENFWLFFIEMITFLPLMFIL